jgi:hypothetical protein
MAKDYNLVLHGWQYCFIVSVDFLEDMSRFELGSMDWIRRLTRSDVLDTAYDGGIGLTKDSEDRWPEL